MSSKVAWRVFSALYAGRTATTFFSWSGIRTAAENNTHDSGYNPPRVNDARRTDALAVASLLLIVAIAFGDVLIGINNFYMRDLTRYYYPTKQILREIVYGGEFPYWNRYFSAGQPIAANPEHEVFYPLTWLILLPSYDLGYRLLILVHIYIALYRGWYAQPRASKSLTRVVWIALLSATALGVGAAQVLPAIDHVRDSARSRPFDFDLVSAWSMPWSKFAELIYPNILGHISIK